MKQGRHFRRRWSATALYRRSAFYGGSWRWYRSLFVVRIWGMATISTGKRSSRHLTPGWSVIRKLPTLYSVAPKSPYHSTIATPCSQQPKSGLEAVYGSLGFPPCAESESFPEETEQAILVKTQVRC